MLVNSKILVIEDDSSLLMVIRKYLGVQNDVETAVCIRDARRIIASKSFDVVLLDKCLPDGDGIVLISELKQKALGTAIIVMTGDEDFNTVHKAITLGADDYVLKSDNLIPDLMVRIPVAQRQAELKAKILSMGELAELALPTLQSELTEAGYKSFLDSAERIFLSAAIRLSNNDATQAASRIGLAKSTIFKKISDLGMVKRSWVRRAPSGPAPKQERLS
jgi:DNA-binding NtrC family response regulator